MKQMLSITRKELKAYFGSPMAAIFIGTFLLASFFAFFWVETFFARNIADIRPLFQWMPILMIFLVAALTMRQWSEEQKMGTLEVLLTLPVKISHLVAGKFLAVLLLVGLALALTLGLPITVAILGDLDWGPVIGGYLGALLMAAAYIAIGVFVSSRTDNQIIALILTVLLAGACYLIGASEITGLVGNQAGDFLRALGTGSRFLSIERGVVDVRDLVYYTSLTIFFLLLNVISLDRKRWSYGPKTAGYRRCAVASVIFVALNLIALNIWLNRVHALRLDMTENGQYSLSQPSRDLISNLEEPLLLRGYFSERTHPLLAPLVPRIRDLMEEYGVASDGKVEVSFVDPKHDAELEAEANQQYSIKPVPFQIAGRYESSVVNSYFNILIKYGDQYVTLGFDDLIEIQRRKDGQLDVGLRNLEYDFTRSMKKVIYGFQSLASVFENSGEELALTAYVSNGSLPQQLQGAPGMIEKVAQEIAAEADGKFKFSFVDPDGPGPGMTRQQLIDKGVRPFVTSPFGDEGFYLHLFLSKGSDEQRVFLSALGEELSEADIRKDLEAALKRSASGFLKTVGLWTPKPAAPTYPGMPASGSTYQMVSEVLRESYNVTPADLTNGRVSGDIDVLLLVAPQDLQDAERYAVDQYLMRGGAVIALAGRYVLDLQPYSESLAIKKVENSITDLLAGYGVEIGEALVMDMQNEPFPIPVTRNLGGFVVQEIHRVNYPFFVDIRQSGMDAANPVVANLPAVTLAWSSPVVIKSADTAALKTATLLTSSPDSWLETKTTVQPDFDQHPQLGFPVGDKNEKQPLAVTLQGSFTSYYAERPAPELKAASKSGEIEEEQLEPKQGKKEEKEDAIAPPTIKKSPESARLLVVGSSEFLNDTVIRISQGLGEERYLNSLELIQNMVDWSVEDEELLTIRSRGSHARILRPLTESQQSFWEGLNYAFALLALAGVSLFGGLQRRRERPLAL